jgi:hypothetical protein
MLIVTDGARSLHFAFVCTRKRKVVEANQQSVDAFMLMICTLDPLVQTYESNFLRFGSGITFDSNSNHEKHFPSLLFAKTKLIASLFTKKNDCKDSHAAGH